MQHANAQPEKKNKVPTIGMKRRFRIQDSEFKSSRREAPLMNHESCFLNPPRSGVSRGLPRRSKRFSSFAEHASSSRLHPLFLQNTRRDNRSFVRQNRFVARGLTFIEMLVTIGIFAVVMIAITGSVLIFYRANSVALEQSFQIESARRGVELMVRDLREAAYGDDGAFPLASIASTSLTFYSDTDRDDATERITYDLTGTALLRSVVNPSGSPPQYIGPAATSTVSEYVRNIEEATPIFRYFNASGVEISDYNEIVSVVSVTVSLVVNVQPIRAPKEFTLRSSATLRNLRPQ